MRRLIKQPAWVRPGAKYDLDFGGSRYWGGYFSMASANNGSQDSKCLMQETNGGANASTYYAPDTDGVYKTFPQYGSRRTGYGLWVEGYSTMSNFCLWCRDLTNAAWTASNCTVAKNQTGADGKASTASSLTATAPNATVLQTVSTLTSNGYTGSALVKRITGTGAISMTVDGSTYTTITGSLNSTTYTAIPVPTQTLTSATIGFKIATSGDAIAVDFVQLENNPVATSPILTTTASVARGAEICSFNTPSSGVGFATNDGYRLLHDINHSTPASILVEYSGNFDPTHSHLIYGDDVSDVFVTGAAGGGVITITGAGGSYSSADSDVSGLYTLNKVAVRWDGTGSGVCVNGGNLTTSTSIKYRATDLGLTHGAMGNNGAAILPLNGYIKRATFWRRALTDGEMIGESAVNSNN